MDMKEWDVVITERMETANTGTERNMSFRVYAHTVRGATDTAHHIIDKLRSPSIEVYVLGVSLAHQEFTHIKEPKPE